MENGKTLLILEVGSKQAFIFGSIKLADNIARSAQIAYVTSSAFFKEVASGAYSEEQNLVYTGGGHTVLQFDSSENAKKFAEKVTCAVLKRYRGMEMFAKQIPYDAQKSPGENLSELTKALERKKALRRSAFRQTGFGIEDAIADTDSKGQDNDARNVWDNYREYPFPSEFDRLAGDDGFLAVVHADGNSLGARVQKIYDKHKNDWYECRKSLKNFSQNIQQNFEQAFKETLDVIIEKNGISAGNLPIRPVILAGDDVCWVCRGSLALESARIFLEKLSALENQEQPGEPYAACAGVAVVHTKYPFHQAYNLAEELCSSAKKLGASIDPGGHISAMDWHIEFGQLRGDLDTQREDYETEDGNRIELRPVTVVVPEKWTDAAKTVTSDVRTYSFFRKMCETVEDGAGKIARGKVKELRTAMKQGETETEFSLKKQRIWKHFKDSAVMDGKEPFMKIGSEENKRCLLFDSIEIFDHVKFFEVD